MHINQNDTSGIGERDHPGRSRWRPADWFINNVRIRGWRVFGATPKRAGGTPAFPVRTPLPGHIGGFTRKELIVTIACVALLALLVSMWRKRSHDLPGRIVCQQNLRQLLIGFNSYEPTIGHLPAAARIGIATNEDWIFWQPDRLLEESAIASHLTNFLANLRCPTDTKFSLRGYPYSYSMNVHLEKSSTRRIPNHPQLILLYEEEAPNDGACQVGGSTDRLSARHVQRSNAGFLDGHVELITDSAGTSSGHAGR